MMVILNMGIPRSGTTWAFNVFRHILDNRGIRYKTVNANSHAEVNAALDGTRGDENTIIHMHDVTEQLLHAVTQPGFIPFFSYRDPRDVVVSQMSLHGTDFETAVRMTMSAYRSFELASRIQGMMLIPYPHIRHNAQALILQLALRLGFVLDFCTLEKIAEMTSIHRHRKIMQKTGSRDDHLLGEGHIQSGENGRWKNELSAEQKERVNSVFSEPVRFFGFDCLPPETTAID